MSLNNKSLFAMVLLGLAGLKSTLAFSATSSWYWPETGNQGACGGFIKNGDWVVALDARHYDRGGMCNKMIRITANGKTQTARIGDRCEMCRSTDGIDMTPELFSAFASRDVGIIDVSWEFADGSGGGGGGGGGNNNNNNNHGNDHEWKPEPPKQEPPRPEPPKPEPPRQPEPPKNDWTPPKEEWKPPAETPRESEPAWTPPAANTPAPSPWQNEGNHDGDDNNDEDRHSDGKSQISSEAPSQSSASSNATSEANESSAESTASWSSTASSVVPSVSVVLNGQQIHSNPAANHALAHLHQAILQVASLVVEAADTI